MVALNELKTMVFTFKNPGDMQGVLSDLKGKKFGIGRGLKNVDYHFDEAYKNFAVIYAETKEHNTAILIVLIDVSSDISGVKNRDYFKESVKNGLISIPQLKVGPSADLYDLIGDDIQKAWKKLENKKRGLGQRAIEIIFKSYGTKGDFEKVLNDFDKPAVGLRKVFKEGKKTVTKPNLFKIIHSGQMPLFVPIIDFETKNTVRIFVFFDQGSFTNKKILTDKVINVPIMDLGTAVTSSDINNGMKMADKITYNK
ncbi:MAG: hypothetical protein WC307_00685 [Candidatus Nanoarchaeia archaeon]|jgi:hypothetical protein